MSVCVFVCMCACVWWMVPPWRWMAPPRRWMTTLCECVCTHRIQNEIGTKSERNSGKTMRKTTPKASGINHLT